MTQKLTLFIPDEAWEETIDAIDNEWEEVEITLYNYAKNGDYDTNGNAYSVELWYKLWDDTKDEEPSWYDDEDTDDWTFTTIEVKANHEQLMANAGLDPDCEHVWKGVGGLDSNPGVFSLG